MRSLLRFAPALCLFFSCPLFSAQVLPTVRIANGASQIIFRGQPFLILGGELGNSSSGTAAQADTILPRLAKLHFNTVLMPVAWDQIEQAEGHFDFSILDHWIAVARQQHLHLVLLWFGSWKNALSEYAPDWVLSDTKRFPREISADGLPLPILAPLSQQTLQADCHAFAALMHHLRIEDASQQTVLMVQVENEIGFTGLGGRDRSANANQLFDGPVPLQLVRYLRAHRAQLPRHLAKTFHPSGNTWMQIFGATADEAFMAWYYANFVNQVAQAGKMEYDLPMYMNAQLPAPFELAGEHPSGGPYPAVQPIYRAAATSIDFYAPDIYWPDFAHWIREYQDAGNPVFIPEARLDLAAFNALYTLGESRGFGFSPFAVDSLPEGHTNNQSGSPLPHEYKLLGELSPILLRAQQKNHVRALVIDATSPRPSQTFTLGGYLFKGTLSHSWLTQSLEAKNGAMIVIQRSPNAFYILGAGLSVSFHRDPDIDNRVAGIASIDRLFYVGGKWMPVARLNGDESNQGRQLIMDAHIFHVYRVRLYAINR